MNRRVVITGWGLASPLAADAQGLHEAAVAGRQAGARQPEWALNGMLGPLAAPHSTFDAKGELGRDNLRPLDRTGRLAAAAAKRALDHSGWSPADLEERNVGLAVGTLFGSVQTIAGFDRRSVSAGPSYAKPMDFANSVINAAAGQAGIRFNLRGVNATISGDLTAGLQSLAYAADLIRFGRIEAILAGGADELCVESVYGFHKLGLLCGEGTHRAVPLAADPTGLLPAEGAAFLMLEERDVAERRGARILGEILGHGSAFDSGRRQGLASSRPSLDAATRAALADAGLASEAIDCVSLSAHGSALDAEELAGLNLATGDRGPGIAIAAKAATGEALGAAGALQTILALESLRLGVAPGIPGISPPTETSAWTVGPEPRPLDGSTALVTAVGLQGKAAALVARVAPGSHTS